MKNVLKPLTLLILFLFSFSLFAQGTKEKGLEDEINDTLKSIKSLSSEFSEQFKNGNPLSVLPREKLSEIIDTNMGQTPLGQMAKRSPKMKEAMLDIFLSKDALPGLASIAGNHKKLKNCGVVILIIIVLSFILGLIASHKEKLIERLFAKAFKWLLTMSAIWFTVYMFFGDELKPSIKIMIKHFL